MIREVFHEDIPACVNIIKQSFKTVADEFGFTEENAPRFTAFATSEERLLWHMDARPWVKRKSSPDFNWGIVLKESNKVVGMIEVFNIQNARMGDIGYRISPEYWNMGITTEALKEVVRFIFENTELDRLNGNADVRNIASNKVMEKCGFIKEGTVRQGKMVSVYCDYNIYGMLRDDYMGLLR